MEIILIGPVLWVFSIAVAKLYLRIEKRNFDREKEKKQLLVAWNIYLRNSQILDKVLENQYARVYDSDSPERIKQKVHNNKLVRHYQEKIKQEFSRKDFDTLWKKMNSFWGRNLRGSLSNEVERLKKIKEVEIKEALRKEHGEWY